MECQKQVPATVGTEVPSIRIGYLRPKWSAIAIGSTDIWPESTLARFCSGWINERVNTSDWEGRGNRTRT